MELLRLFWEKFRPFIGAEPGLYGYVLVDEDGHEVLMLGRERNPGYRAFRQRMKEKYPTCASCGTRDYWQWHHIVPVAWPGGEALELVESNGLPLCASPSTMCHLNDGHLGDYRSRNPDVREESARKLYKRTHRPYPPEE